MSVPANDALLVFRSNRSTISLFNRITRKYSSPLGLFNTSGTGTHCAATIWLDDNGNVNLDRPSAGLPNLLTRLDGENDAWLSDTFVIIGIGDMRGGLTTTYEIDLTQVSKNQLIFRHEGPNVIGVYYAGNYNQKHQDQAILCP